MIEITKHKTHSQSNQDQRSKHMQTYNKAMEQFKNNNFSGAFKILETNFSNVNQHYKSMFLYCFLLYILREQTPNYLEKLQYLSSTINTAKKMSRKYENKREDYL